MDIEFLIQGLDRKPFVFPVKLSASFSAFNPIYCCYRYPEDINFNNFLFLIFNFTDQITF